MIAHASDYYYIERPSLGFDSSFEYEEEKRSSPVSNRVNISQTFSEALTIVTRGWVYHPALVVYSLALSPEWEQMREKRTLDQFTSIGKSNTFLQGYEAELTFFRYKPYTLDIFGYKNMGTVRDSFAGRTKQNENVFGSTLSLKYNVLSTIIRYEHRENINTGSFTSQTKRNEVTLSASNRSQIGNTRFNLSYMDTNQKTDDFVNDTINESFNLSHALAFSDNDNAVISSNMLYNRILDRFSESELYSINESLLWRHKKNLTTRYTFRYDDRLTDRNSSNTSRNQTILGNFNLTHLLYENLSTTLSAGVNQNQSSNNKVMDHYAGIYFGYERTIPWGNIFLNMGQKYSLVDVSKSSTITNVSNEPVNLTSSPSFLKNTDIDINSIVVTDINGVRYLETGNYVLSRIGSMTRIRCILGGQLDIDLDCSIGASILIDYQYQSGFPFDYSNYTQSYGAGLYLWNALNIYYRYDRSQQKFLRGVMPEKLTKDLSHKAGTELEYKWSKTNLSFEDNQSNTLPFEQTLIEEIITLRPRPNMFMSFILGYGRTAFTDLGEAEKFSNITAKIQKIISNRLKLTAEGFHKKRSGTRNDSADLGFLLTFEWIYKIYNGNIIYSYTNEEDKVLQDSIKNNYFLFTVKRELF